MSEFLDIFAFRDSLIRDYRRYIESFLKIRDNRIEEYIKTELDKERLWTDPLVQVNPSYRRGATVVELIKEGVLHPDCERYFCRNGRPFQFHYHQEQAIRTAKRGEPYVLTTGTGSGKSMTYVVPIFNDILCNPKSDGVRAILVYPMNALVNSQEEELRKFLNQVPDSPIRLAKYTGQENLQQKNELQNNPPHILLTNYLMLELILTRSHESVFVDSSSTKLKYLVLDELHTYRGRKGADIAILVRRLRQRTGRNFVCIGTSATMSSSGNRTERRQVISKIASKVFGVEIPVENVIDETLERSIPCGNFPNSEELRFAVIQGLPPEAERTKEAFLAHPLSAWLEMTFGLTEENGHLSRHVPMRLETGSQELATITGCSLEQCRDIIIQMFLWGSRVKGLAFRLHQFISQGCSVYSTIEPKDKRLLTLDGQYITTENRLLYPLAFCRECGQEYYVVRYNSSQKQLLPSISDTTDIDSEYLESQEGYFILDEPNLWTADDTDKLPHSWFKVTKKYGRQLKSEYQRFEPQRLFVLPDGTIKEVGQGGVVGWFVPKPFKFCLHCGIFHEGNKKEKNKLSYLSNEGRSTATTLLSVCTVNQLKNDPGVAREAAKILSFTDNRQDASLQAGHFNDFIQTVFLRSALHKALSSSDSKCLTHENLAQKVVEAMGLSQEDYAKQVSTYGIGKRRNEEVFRQLIEYWLYEDLQRGWRTQPNLEQTGLLEIGYKDLREICNDPKPWERYNNPLLLQATPEQREFVICTLLNQLKRSLAIDAYLLQPEQQNKFKQEVVQLLKEPWTFDFYEQLKVAGWASISENDDPQKYICLRLTYRSKIGNFLRSPQAWPWRSEQLSQNEYENLIADLVTVLADCGYILKENTEVQLRVTAMVWQSVYKKEISYDPLLCRWLEGTENKSMSVNQFFQEFYPRMGTQIHRLEGREHTGQVSNEKRIEREERFRKGELSALFCSPTMELGIDIADLSVVHLRNVPPNPANYTQRSGRAGRSGQQALVITYATTNSYHDQYFFHRQERMVAGVVTPSKIELGNQDLIQSHIYSVWLAKTGQNLQESMNEILDLEKDDYPIKDHLYQQLTLSPSRIDDCVNAVEAILQDSFVLADLEKTDWFSRNWIRTTIENALTMFDQACNRWRELYREASMQRRTAQETINRAATGKITKEERSQAEQQLREAQRQIDLLVGQKDDQFSSDDGEFYPYRYFASEGFLPGYNFPRLPVRAYIDSGERGKFIHRSRHVAVREFAPGNIVYYEGSKFRINKIHRGIGGIEAELLRMSLCFNCGYFHQGEFRDFCENCGAEIKPDLELFPAKLNHVLPMKTMLTIRRERITCDEEERSRYGYNLRTHFRYDNAKRKSGIVRVDGQEVFRLDYSDTAKIYYINGGFRKTISQDFGFKLSKTDGKWIMGNVDTKEIPVISEVFLAVDSTANILVVEPIIPDDIEPQNQTNYLISLQYSLEAAIKTVYKLEENELASERLGDGKRILFWEAAEGGAGVLSQILNDPNSFQVLADQILNICHFVQEKPSCIAACYDCLLTYSNQFDHPFINRYLLQTTLKRLTNSVVEAQTVKMSREKQYQMLLGMTDPNSPLERKVLEAIYTENIPLPDAAQELISKVNIKPDFIYKRPKIAIFCDGSIHEHPKRKQMDKVERENLQYNTGYFVIVFSSNEADWQEPLKQLKAYLQG